MSKAKLAVAIPVVAASQPASQVLDMMQRHGASAVLVSAAPDTAAYRVHRVEQVRAAHEADAAAIAGHAKAAAAVPLLPTKQAGDMGLDFSALNPSLVSQAFRDIDHAGMVAAVAPTAAGRRMATVLLNPLLHETDHRALTFLGAAYRCNVDNWVYSSPGKCPVHRVELERVEIDG